MLVVQGPSEAQPEQQLRQQEGSDGGGGVVYGLLGVSADATLVMSEWVKTDDNGWTKVGWSLVASVGQFRLVCKMFVSLVLSPTRSKHSVVVVEVPFA